MTYDFDQVIERRGTDSAKWNYYDRDALPLWVADMDFPAPPAVIEALRERVEHGIFGYGLEPAELREVVTARLKRLYHWSISPDALVFIPGVVRGINLACRAVASPGDGILVQLPVYPPIHSAPAIHNMIRHNNELIRDARGYYTIDFDDFRASIDEHTRLFILCNPHNPVGRVFTRQELEQVAEICMQHDLIICSDEIHCDLLFSGQQHVPIGSLSNEIENHTITLMAPSKTYNIAGLDCSVAIIPDEELRESFIRARSGLVPAVNIMGYVAALSAYQHGDDWLSEALAYLEANRDFLYDYVNTKLPGITMRKPEGTYLAWLDCREAGIRGDPGQFFLNRAKVALNEGASFGTGGDGFVRLNFGCPRSTLESALERMRTALERLS